MIKYRPIIYRNINRIKSQSALEYAMVVVCLAAALLAMQIYIKRSIQGRVRENADQVGQQYSIKTTTSNTAQTFTSSATINGNPQIIEVTDPETGDSELREMVVIHRQETQGLTQQAGNYEQTGKLSEEELFE